MARIAGVDLPNEKRVEYGLTYVYGIGVKSSNKILAEAGINPDTRVKDLTEDELAVYRRGRNAKTSHIAKNATTGDYHKATGLEALFGYLYLSGDIHRIKELFYMIKGQSDD